MFEHNFFDTSSYIDKRSREEAYRDFVKEIGISLTEYPFSFNGKGLYKGRPQVFVISGWGGYMNAVNEWRIFIAYRGNHPKHTIQHSWQWDDGRAEVYDHKKFEFVN